MRPIGGDRMQSATSVTSDAILDSCVMNPPDCDLWDFAGMDGLQAAIALFSSAVTYIAPFQSLTITFEQRSGSLLRLCENNFRVLLPAALDFEQAVRNQPMKVWVKPCSTANLVMPASIGLKHLAHIATTKPLYTLDPFPCDRAVPARVDGRAILAWHHLWQGQPRLLIQTADSDMAFVQAALTGRGF